MVTGSEALTAIGSTTADNSRVRSCADTLNFVGKTLGAAEALARHCHQGLGHVYRVPDVAPAGIVVSQSPPYTGNELVVSTGPLTNPWAVLPRASDSPVAKECTATLHLSEDGNAGPLTCGGDHVNVEAWDYFVHIHAPIMGLPRHQTVCQVAKYIGAYYVSGPVSYSIFELANVYNGWHVPAGLAAHILVGNRYRDTCKGELHSLAP
jgi:hypothetical protein